MTRGILHVYKANTMHAWVRSHQSLCQWVLGKLFQSRRIHQSLLSRIIPKQLHLSHRKLPCGQSAGFIKHHIGHMRQGLQAVPTADEQTAIGQKPCGRRQRSRRGQRQSTWTGNHQQRHHHPQCRLKTTRPPPICHGKCSQNQ